MDDDRRQEEEPTGWPVEIPDRPGTPGTEPGGGPELAGTATDERLDALPAHEDDAARGVNDSIGGGVMGAGGTAETSRDASGQPVPEEDIQEDQTGLAGMPPGPITRT